MVSSGTTRACRNARYVTLVLFFVGRNIESYCLILIQNSGGEKHKTKASHLTGMHARRISFIVGSFVNDAHFCETTPTQRRVEGR